VRGNFFFALLFFLGNCSAEPALPEPLRQVVDDAIQSGALRGVAAGWIDGSQRATAFFGTVHADTTFEIGAATEVFTSLLLAQGVLEGKTRMQATLKQLLPDIAFADSALAAISLEALVTHRSGLPVMPPNAMPRDVADPYAEYGEAPLRAFLANYRLPVASSEYGYSVVDAGVLGYALGRCYDSTFEKALHDKVFAPLGMKHAGFDDEHLADAYARGSSVRHWHFGALAGAAGMRATLDDLLDFLQVNLRPEGSPLRSALLLTRQGRGRTPVGEYGLGWNIHEANADGQTWPLLWRASSTAGFSTFIGFRTDHQQALVLLGNTDADLSAIGMALLEGRVPPALPRPHLDAPHELHGDDFTGLYQVRGGIEIIVRERDHQLFAQLRGDQATHLRAFGDEAFGADTEAFSISFQREAGQVTSLLLGHAGVNLLAQRLSTRAPHVARASLPVEAKDLREFVGDYLISSGSMARVSLDSNLSMQLTGREPLQLAAFAKDHFACVDESCEVGFMRDADGAVVRANIDFAGGQHEAARVHWSKP